MPLSRIGTYPTIKQARAVSDTLSRMFPDTYLAIQLEERPDRFQYALHADSGFTGMNGDALRGAGIAIWLTLYPDLVEWKKRTASTPMVMPPIKIV